MMSGDDGLKQEILEAIGEAPERRVRPHELGRLLAETLGVSVHAVQEAVGDLAVDGRIIYTYRDPASYLELPTDRESVQPV